MLPIENIAARLGEGLVPAIVYKTTKVGPISFNTLKTGSVLRYDMGDGTIYDSNFALHNYALAGEKTITIYADDPSLITGIGDNASRELTYVDLSLTTNLTGVLNFSTNDIATFVQPASTNFCSLQLNDNPISGVLDISNVKLGGTFYAFNTSITSILHSADNTQFSTEYRINNSNITGTHLMQGVKLQSGRFWAASNLLLTQITFNPDTSQVSNSFILNTCNLTGELDISMIDIAGFIYFYGNLNLTNVIHKATLGPIARYWAWGTGIINWDVSMFTNFGGNVRVFSCPDLETISMPPASPSVFSDCWLHDNAKLQGVDFSGFMNLGANFNLHTNPLATFYTFPLVDSGNGCVIVLYGNNSLVSLDLSNITVNGVLDVSLNPLLSTLTLNNITPSLPVTRIRVSSNPALANIDASMITLAPVVTYIDVDGSASAVAKTFIPPNSLSSTVTTLNAYNSPLLNFFDPSTMQNFVNVDNHYSRLFNWGLTASEINLLLVNLDTIATGVNINRTIQISGSAAPDGTSGGNDGLTAQANLITKGFTII